MIILDNNVVILKNMIDYKDFHRVDTTLLLTKDMRQNVYRDADVYGKVKFRVWNSDTERAIAGVEVQIDDHKTNSDKNGNVSLVRCYHLHALRT